MAGFGQCITWKYEFDIHDPEADAFANAKIRILAEEYKAQPYLFGTSGGRRSAYLIWHFPDVAAAEAYTEQNRAAIEASARELGLIQ